MFKTWRGPETPVNGLVNAHGLGAYSDNELLHGLK